MALLTYLFKLSGICGNQVKPLANQLPAEDCEEMLCQDSESQPILYACGGVNATLLYSMVGTATPTSVTQSSLLWPTPTLHSEKTRSKERASNTATLVPVTTTGTATTQASVQLSGTSTPQNGPSSASQTNNQDIPTTASSSSTASGGTQSPGLGWSAGKTAGVVFGGLCAAAIIALGVYFLKRANKNKSKASSSIESWGNSASEEPWTMSGDITPARGASVQMSRMSLETIREREESLI